MDEPGVANRTRRLLGWIVGSILLGGLLVLAQTTVGWEALLRPWTSVPPGTIVLAFVLVLATFAVRTVRIRTYFQDETQGRFIGLFRLMLVHNLLNNLLPMRTGEASFPILMARQFGVPVLRSVPGLVYLRLLDLHFVVFVGVAVLAFLRNPPLGAASLLLAPLPLALHWARGWVPVEPGSGEGAQARGRIKGAVLNGLRGLPDTFGLFLAIWFWTAVNWTVKLAAFAWILTAFAPLEFTHALLGAATGELSSVLPFHGVAGAGTYEAGVMAGLIPLGVDLEGALTGAVNLHLFVLGTSVLAGGAALLTPVRRGKTGENPGDSDIFDR